MAKRARRPKQTEMHLPTWGGRRGKRKRKRTRVPHRTRPLLTGCEPLHVTLKLLDHVWNLRSARSWRVVEAAMAVASDHLGMRVTHFAVLGNHLHFIVEADDRASLSRGMQGLKVRLAKGLNRMMGTKGQVFTERYHARVLATPAEVRNAIAYVMENAKKHAMRSGREVPSGADRFAVGPETAVATGAARLVAEARTWLLRVGWRRHARTG